MDDIIDEYNDKQKAWGRKPLNINTGKGKCSFCGKVYITPPGPSDPIPCCDKKECEDKRAKLIRSING